MAMDRMRAAYDSVRSYIERERKLLGAAGSAGMIALGAIGQLNQGVPRLVAVGALWVLAAIVFALFSKGIPKGKSFWFGSVTAFLFAACCAWTLYIIAPAWRPFSGAPISGRIDQALIGPEPYGSHIIVVASIVNPTTIDPSIDPGSWALTIKNANGARYVGSPVTMTSTIKPCANGWAHIFTPGDALYAKTKDGIKAFTQGVLEFTFRGVAPQALKDPTNALELTADAIGSQNIDITKTVAEMKAEADANASEIFTGLKNPQPIRCDNNG